MTTAITFMIIAATFHIGIHWDYSKAIDAMTERFDSPPQETDGPRSITKQKGAST